MRLFRHGSLLLLLMAASSQASAFYWTLFQGGGNYPSPAAACGSFTNDNPPLPIVAIVEADPVYFRCYSVQNGTNWAMNKNGYRVGAATCDAPKTYNPATGVCDSPPAALGELCADQSGAPARDPKVGNTDGSCKNVTQSDQAAKCQYLAKNRPSRKVTFTVTDWQKEAGSSTAPSAGYVGSTFGCEIQVLEGSKCTYEPPRPSMAAGMEGVMEPGVHRCTADGIITGAVNETSTADPAGLECLLNPDVCEIPDPTQQEDFKPCAYSYDTDGQRGTCQSIAVEWKTEGETCDYVGTVNGQSACIGKKPTSNGIVIDTEIKTTANADGTTTQTKTDKATQTVCNGSGLNSCSTQITNNKTTVVKNGAGETVSQNSTCSGANCPTSTNPDGNGDGLGDCVGETCGEEGGASSPVEMPELEEVADVGDATGTFYARIKNAPIAQALTSISVPTGGSCSFPAAQTYFGEISLDSFCSLAPQILAGLRYVFLACWAWAAIRLFFTA